MRLSRQVSPVRWLRRLRRVDLPVDTVELAHYLIGKVLVHDIDTARLSGRVVETEAYPVGDAAGQAFHGKTQRNSSRFLERGRAYVYFVHGASFLLNVTSEVLGIAGGVLLRAIEPLDGIDLMAGSNGTTRFTDIGKGPGRLTKVCRLTSGRTDWTCVLRARFGWLQACKNLGQFAKASVSG